MIPNHSDGLLHIESPTLISRCCKDHLHRGLSVTLVSAVMILFLHTELNAQRITYESLRARDRQPEFFVEHLIAANPDTSAGKLLLISTFRIENGFLSFRRYRERDSDREGPQFFAEPTLRFSMSRLTGDAGDDRPEPESIESGDFRMHTWSEMVFADTYEQTRSSGIYLQNMVQRPAEPGTYRMRTEAQSGSRKRSAERSLVKVADTSDIDTAYLYFLDSREDVTFPKSPHTQAGLDVPGNGDETDLTNTPGNGDELASAHQAPLMNMGTNVFFGRDHQLAIWIPFTEAESRYELVIDQLSVRRGDTTATRRALHVGLDTLISSRDFIPVVAMHDDRPGFGMINAYGPYRSGRLYHLSVPNSRFENAYYRIRVKRISATEGERADRPVIMAERVYRSLWLDMPVSLLNLDVAINMLRFILPEEQLRQFRRGSRDDRERRFREFWNERDPTPGREYNELMVEYYRRIDYAFEHFTTPQNPGYDSDQGLVYIRHGEPQSRERIFPANQPARETWYYEGRSFVFEATTGFGDFRLISRP